METTLQKTSLYQIRQDHMNLEALLEETGGELTPDIEMALSFTREQFQEKAISTAFVAKSFDNNLEIIDREIKRLESLRERAQKNYDLLKSRLSEAMVQFGVEKVESPTLKISFRKSESVEIDNVYAIPSEYKVSKTTESISKDAIKKALKEGVEINGAKLVTHRNLQIR